MKLAEACRRWLFIIHLFIFVFIIYLFVARFLINPAKDKDMRKWAVEGLSYLTLDAEVKEKLIEDRVALHALIEVAKVIILKLKKKKNLIFKTFFFNLNIFLKTFFLFKNFFFYLFFFKFQHFFKNFFFTFFFNLKTFLKLF